MQHRARRLLAGALALVVPLSLTASGGAASASGGRGHEFVKVGYFIQWGIYGRDFLVKDLDDSGSAAQLTHINYAFGNVTEDGVCASADAWADYQMPFSADRAVDGVADEPGQPLSRQLQPAEEAQGEVPGPQGADLARRLDLVELLLRRRAHARLAAHLGRVVHRPVHQGQPARPHGWRGQRVCSTASTSTGSGRARRATSATSCEPRTSRTSPRWSPSSAGSSTRTATGYELTAFLPADPAKIDAGFEVDEIFDDLDFATVQGYDFHGAWETTTNHQGQLYSPRRDPDPARFSLDLADRQLPPAGSAGRQARRRRAVLRSRLDRCAARQQRPLPDLDADRRRGRGRPESRTSRCWRRSRAAITVISSTAPTGSTTACSGGATTTR